jgi:catechol 2,3-dioxygenase-like lactoylglutathione lyase family enzyme
MSKRMVPMIHVPDVRATVDWYQGIGFTVLDTYGDDEDGLSFAILSFGSSQVMFSEGGKPSTQFRREVDLYVYTDKVDDLYEQLKERVEIVEGPHDTFYGMHELIIRDLNRFWITFGQPSVFEMLMAGVREGNIDLVQTTLDNHDVKPETLTAALVTASAGKDKNSEIVAMLMKAGAVAPAEVDVETLQSYVGKYKAKQGFEINVSFKDGKLFAAPGAQQPLSLLAVDNFTFRPIAFDDYGILTFNVEEGKTVGCVLKHGSTQMQLKRA